MNNFCLVLIIFFCGCVQMQLLPYLDQALVLQEFGAEKDRQQKFVTNVDGNFDKLLAAANNGEIKKYKTQKEIVEVFGDPVLIKEVVIDGQTFQRALYRYAIQSKGPKRLYLFFDAQGNLMRWESI